jgi:hypothetical protein
MLCDLFSIKQNQRHKFDLGENNWHDEIFEFEKKVKKIFFCIFSFRF